MADVLVVYATKMGSTQEIAETIGAELRLTGLSVDVISAAADPDPRGYRVVLVGSALYLRRWRRDAVRYLRRHSRTLRTVPVWLFQSGWCGPAGVSPDVGVPASVRRLAERIDAEPPETFGGRLDPGRARGLRRWIAKNDELSGDYRNWAEIRSWARRIGSTVAAAAPDRDREPGTRTS